MEGAKVMVEAIVCKNVVNGEMDNAVGVYWGFIVGTKINAI
jgi:hypothetical protein